MSDDIIPEAPPEPQPEPQTFEEWQQRLEKCYQFRGLEIPAFEVPALIEHFDAGRTPFQAFELIHTPTA